MSLSIKKTSKTAILNWVSMDPRVYVKYISYKAKIFVPNVVVAWLKLLHRIRQVRGSNLGLDTGYAD
jgi:hypothetical protein